MLDLGKVKQEQYKIKLADGTILKLKKPTQAMLITLYEMKDIADSEDIEILDKLYEFLLRIFNRNLNDITYTKNDIEEILDIKTAMVFLQDYFDFHYKQLGE
ncbi:MAG: hypothetical protein LKJ25_05025 [Clostridia bacterium]|jgi:hypothetical protein|nr:hypothetical protein [Clostridia bacterium]